MSNLAVGKPLGNLFLDHCFADRVALARGLNNVVAVLLVTLGRGWWKGDRREGPAGEAVDSQLEIDLILAQVF